jgi:hypothetical protein
MQHAERDCPQSRAAYLIEAPGRLVFGDARLHATRGQPERPELAGALSPLLLLLLGTAVAAVSPKYAQYLWLLAFGGVLAHRFVGGRSAA